MFINFLRLILGFVEFEATDGFTERFLNLCTINGINLWNVRNDGVKLKAFTDIKSYKGIKKTAKKSGMKIKIVKKHGLPFFINKNKTRAGVLIGLLLAVIFLIFSSCVIWNIEVVGNDTVKTEALEESLKDYGVKIGGLKSKIDSIEIKEKILKEYSDISWVSLNIFGTKALLEVKENVKKPDITKDETPTNIIAEKDGQITLVEGYRGKNAVKEGDVVLNGDLLISGIIVNEDNTETLLHSFGKVYAKTDFMLAERVERLQENNCIVVCDEKYYIYFLGLEIPLVKRCKGDLLYRGVSLLRSEGGELPFGISWECFYEYQSESLLLSESEAKLIALLSCVEKKRNEISDDETVFSEKHKVKSCEEYVEIVVNLSAEENIAVLSEILIE